MSSSKIVWQGGSVFTKTPIRAILQDRPGANPKIGAMRQLWIVPEVKRAADTWGSVCGMCPSCGVTTAERCPCETGRIRRHY